MAKENTIIVLSGTPFTEQAAVDELTLLIQQAHSPLGISPEEAYVINGGDKNSKYPHGVAHGRFKVTITVEQIKPYG